MSTRRVGLPAAQEANPLKGKGMWPAKIRKHRFKQGRAHPQPDHDLNPFK
jgi:hypothetical protein